MHHYQKTILYVYPNLKRYVDGIDDLVEKAAVNSFYDLTPCEIQANNILRLIENKELLIELKLLIDDALKAFSNEEIKYFEYKYFKRKPKSFFFELDTQSRNYFRKQLRLLAKFTKIINGLGINEETFEKYLKIGFISNVYDRVVYLDEKSKEKVKKQRKKIA